MSGHRQAALALHALAVADREAILAELPQADRTTLHGYLHELTALGFEGAEWDAAQSGAGPDTASAAAVFAILEHEPAALVAQVLSLQAWPWQAGLLALYPSARREQIRAALPARLAPAQAAFLRSTLQSRLAASAPAAEAAPLKTWWRLWRR
jgi:hypothetical protein